MPSLLIAPPRGAAHSRLSDPVERSPLLDRELRAVTGQLDPATACDVCRHRQRAAIRHWDSGTAFLARGQSFPGSLTGSKLS